MAMPYEPPPELAGLSLAEIAELAAQRRLPDVARWNPERSGESAMRIAADGRWYHEGGEITRPAMIRAFAALLRRDEGGRHWLVTPHEKLSIEVEDAAFVAVDVKREGEGLAFRLNTDDFVIAGPDHAIFARGNRDVPALYLAVRHGTEARLNRSTYLQLIDLALEGDELSVTSQGLSFSLVPA